MSYLNILTILSFKKYHIDWKINIYSIKKENSFIECTLEEFDNITTSDNLKKNNEIKKNDKKMLYSGVDYFNELKKIPNVFIHNISENSFNFSEKYKYTSETIKSDYLRLQILNTYGGVWSDFDIIFTNNIEEHHSKYNNKKFIFYKDNTSKNSMMIPATFLISHKNNSILNTLLKYINIFYNPHSATYHGDDKCLKSFMFQAIFDKNQRKTHPILGKIVREINLSELAILNADCYCKIKPNQLDILFSNSGGLIENYIQNDSNIFGIQWFSKEKKSIEYENKLNIDDLCMKESKCLMDGIVKKFIKRI
tara:strand:+ start:2350 stop:3276 length:927 start_codon:yes stop_codon:yes gene_type:complete